ncbi:hypothetical protein BBJ28_00023456, partial [Nothophytophthora sp. Chile5]
ALVEEIDSEADDAEFDERAHWSRRGARKKARSPRRNSRGVDKSQPSIALFCVKEGASTAAKASNSKGEVGDTELDKKRDEKLSPLESIALAEASPLEVQETEAAGSQEQPEESSEIDSPATLAPVQETPRTIKKSETSGSSNDAVPSVLMSSGRPKRQAVVRAEILQQQQKLLDAVAARNNPPSFLTPPPSAKRASGMSGDSAAGGRKRKLEMNRKKASPPTKAAATINSPAEKPAAQAFFLSEREKKQLQEIEAVSSFREHLRQTREKDLAFFNGKTANPFFQARSSSTKRSNSVENEDGVIEIHEGEGDDGKSRRTAGTGRWSKALSLFPEVQHVFTACAELEATTTDITVQPKLLKKSTLETSNATEMVVINEEDQSVESSLPAAVMGKLQSAMNGQVVTEASFSELFWFREYLDASVTAGGSLEVDASIITESEQESEEIQLIEDLVESHGMREKRVRELLGGLQAAKAKRLDREQNLSLVDRYTPVSASGLVGNRESLLLLSSWLSAWKVGGGDRERRDCFESELFIFEDDDSDSDDEVGDLCRLFVLEGESGAGKSAAVYACAEELGYDIIEINAAQNRSGKSIMEIAGEATQSTRVLHVGGKDDKSKKKHKKKRRRHSETRSSGEKPTAASLSVVLFEDVDLVFDEDKGFLNALCAIAKHSKCPIVVTCAQLPDAFPAAPARLSRTLNKPSMGEFATWLRLVAFLERLPLAPSLVDALGNFFERDVRRSLHFLQAHLPLADAQTKTQWQWRHEGKESSGKEVAEASPLAVVPAWTAWSTGRSSFDALSSNLLAELSSVAELEAIDPTDKSREEKEADADAMAELASVMDAASLADILMPPTDSAGSDGSTERTLQDALAASRRLSHQSAMAEIKPKFELPLAFKGCGNSEARFALDYMPMVARLLASTGLQEGRRRASRRNHYLGDVLGDMALIDELPNFNTYLQPDEDQIVAASPASPSPLT